MRSRPPSSGVKRRTRRQLLWAQKCSSFSFTIPMGLGVMAAHLLPRSLVRPGRQGHPASRACTGASVHSDPGAQTRPDPTRRTGRLGAPEPSPQARPLSQTTLCAACPHASTLWSQVAAPVHLGPEPRVGCVAGTHHGASPPPPWDSPHPHPRDLQKGPRGRELGPRSRRAAPQPLAPAGQAHRRLAHSPTQPHSPLRC